jgi:hypothetical protein
VFENIYQVYATYLFIYEDLFFLDVKLFSLVDVWCMFIDILFKNSLQFAEIMPSEGAQGGIVS